MYESIKQIKEEIAKLKKEIKKLRKLEDADYENGTYDNDYYNAKWKYIQGNLDGLNIALRIVQCNNK